VHLVFEDRFLFILRRLNKKKGFFSFEYFWKKFELKGKVSKILNFKIEENRLISMFLDDQLLEFLELHQSFQIGYKTQINEEKMEKDKNEQKFVK
jgi:hypothetical protein